MLTFFHLLNPDYFVCIINIIRRIYNKEVRVERYLEEMWKATRSYFGLQVDVDYNVIWLASHFLLYFHHSLNAYFKYDLYIGFSIYFLILDLSFPTKIFHTLIDSSDSKRITNRPMFALVIDFVVKFVY